VVFFLALARRESQSSNLGGVAREEEYDEGLTVQSEVPAGEEFQVHRVDFTRVEYNYVAALPDRNAEINVDAKQRPSPANPFAGYATFTSTFYDEMKFMNFINEGGQYLPVWEGDTLYVGRVSLWCGG
jgi:hypothetical protein